ncbi:hypothetical protein [Oryza sativa Japonica Group]|uniref:Uncharacterized protein P0035F12.11 n=1 Tax=Oryza sativa subsp. japonica TaxID=39947 RepID=Q5N8V5_ORYSJ|nr:hypothetical protein [Oryza sativa Japonica Group]
MRADDMHMQQEKGREIRNNVVAVVVVIVGVATCTSTLSVARLGPVAVRRRPFDQITSALNLIDLRCA